MVADALVYHPAVSHYLRFVATTVGRDKVLRTIQYFARFYAWYLYRTNNPSSSIAPWATAKTQLGLTRKIMRVGKFVEHLRAGSEIYDASLKSSNGDKIAQYLQIARQLGYAGYLFFDSLTVLDATGIRKDASAATLQATAYRFWFAGLAASAAAGFYSHYKLRARLLAVDEKDAEAKVEKVKIARQQKIITTQLVSDLCDLTIPGTALGITSFDEGIIWLAGTTSSVLGVWGTWNKVA